MSFHDLAHLATLRPLERPLVYPRGGLRRSPFRASWRSTVGDLARELRLHGAAFVVLELDMRERDFRVDGLPRADARTLMPGVVLSFKATHVSGSPALRYEVTSYTDWRDNVRAIALGLEALRAVDRYGVTHRGEQYAGWKQLSVGADVERGRELIREHGGVVPALKATHPDHGGNEDDFKAISAAREASIA